MQHSTLLRTSRLLPHAYRPIVLPHTPLAMAHPVGTQAHTLPLHPAPCCCCCPRGTVLPRSQCGLQQCRAVARPALAFIPLPVIPPPVVKLTSPPPPVPPPHPRVLRVPPPPYTVGTGHAPGAPGARSAHVPARPQRSSPGPPASAARPPARPMRPALRCTALHPPWR